MYSNYIITTQIATLEIHKADEDHSWCDGRGKIASDIWCVGDVPTAAANGREGRTVPTRGGLWGSCPLLNNPIGPS